MLFSEIQIGKMKLKNRFVRSATWEGMAKEDGSVTDELVELYRKLSENEIGLIITGHTYVSKEGKATPRQLGLYSEEFVPGFKKLVTQVHSSGAKILIQLSHSGRFGRKSFFGLTPLDPDSITKREIKRLVESFCLAAERAKEAGFDGVQLHAAHGYLISEFFSPLYNHRKDEYGGSVRNRARFAEQILVSIKKRLGSDYPVLFKINCEDFKDNGLTLNDAVQIAEILADEGADAVEISGGLLTSRRRGPCRPYKGPYFLEQALYFKEKLTIPVILVGGIRSYGDAEEILQKGIDLISMSRPFICEPDLVKRWKNGDRKDSECESDNLCLKVVKTKDPVRCWKNENRAFI